MNWGNRTRTRVLKNRIWSRAKQRTNHRPNAEERSRSTLGVGKALSESTAGGGPWRKMQGAI